MPSLEAKPNSNHYIISLQDNFSFKFPVDEIDSLITASLSIKKNIIYLKQDNPDVKIKNEECLENNDQFLFIPHRLKKQFYSLEEYLK